ncbi:MAG: cation diffusion facilitator family transporter [Sphingobacteriales bacterium]|uniref:cation diffusion facilitator family transporter n=1 Tax=Hydrotalea flava TaxID=714549 RepID=UPI0008336561|nr:cation diffusion facilitator family transporter [Hydrotalea flava]RTL48205.1 MAG: cation diffusion facilitator family transporter [Sphingobacteriales bacterium]
MQKEKQNYRLQLFITLLSVVLFAVKIIAFYLTNSIAVLTDALESTVNMLAGLIGLYSLYITAKPKDKEHPYGHGKAEFISAAVEGSLIITAGIYIIFQTIQSFFVQKPVQELDKGIILVAITAIVNFVAGWWCLHIGQKNNSLALKASGKHLQLDTYSTIVIIVGLFIIKITNLFWLDKLLALGISAVIMVNGYKIVRASLAGIMDEADMELLKKLVTTLNQNRRNNWIDLHNLRVIKYGATLHVDCHLTLPWYMNLHEAHTEVDELEALVIKTFGDDIELFVHTDGCLPFSCQVCIKTDCHVRQHAFTQKVTWTLDNILSNQKHNAPAIT